MSDEYIRALSLSLIKNKTLESIKITGPIMTDVCAGYMAMIFKNNTKIKKIDISGCAVSERGAIAIGFALMDNDTLRRVKIGRIEQRKVVKENIERNYSWSGWKSTVCV